MKARVSPRPARRAGKETRPQSGRPADMRPASRRRPDARADRSEHADRDELADRGEYVDRGERVDRGRRSKAVPFEMDAWEPSLLRKLLGLTNTPDEN